MKKEKIILENTSDYLSGNGILNILTTKYPDLPWVSSFDGIDLDLDYYLNHSGEKVISKLVDKLLDENKVLTTTALNRLATIIYNKYSDSWKRVFSAFALQYNPIYNKNYDESFSDTETNSGTNKNTLLHNTTKMNTGTVQDVGEKKNTGTQSNQGSNTGTVQDSGNRVNTGTQTNQGSNTGTVQDSGNKSNTGTQSTVEDTTDNLSYGYNSYDEVTTFGKEVNELKTFPIERKTETTKTGNINTSHDFDTSNPYTEESKLSFSNRKDTDIKSGSRENETKFTNYKETDELEYGVKADGTDSDRKSISTRTGSEVNTHDGNNYTTNTDSWGQRTSKNRVNAFNSGLVDSVDNTTYIGGANGSSGGTAPSGSGGNGDAEHTRVVESGSNTDTIEYDSVKDTKTDSGAETHTITKNGKETQTESFTDYKDELTKTGDETTTISKSGSYNDIETYNNIKESTIESGSENLKSTDSGNQHFSISGSKSENRDLDRDITRTDNLTETTTNTRTDNLSHTDTRTDDLSETTTNTRTDNLTHTDTRTDNLTEATTDTRTDNLSETFTGTDTTTGENENERELTHTYHGEGNIGVTTTQELLTSEVELRKMYSSLFDTIVYPDIDKVMVLAIYGDCHL